MALLGIAVPAWAQDAPPTDAPKVINLLGPDAPPELDEFALQQCARDADVGVIQGEIVVCRDLSEPSDGLWNKEDFERRYAERTALRGAPRAPDFIADCWDQGMPFGCIRVGSVPDAAIMIDVEALPQAPPGSDADRVARGLPPLGEAGDLGRGPISEDELGLPPPPAG